MAGESRVKKEVIVEQAKKIMDSFMLALDKVRDIDESFGAERKEDKRAAEKKDESEYKGFREGFRKRMFKNAPKVKDDYIQAEKKTW
jgi:hypothetical protein